MSEKPRKKDSLVPVLDSSAITLFNSLKPYKVTWTIKTKILNSWRQYSRATGESIELILADQTGIRIGAVVRKGQLNKFANVLKVGQWKTIKTFTLNKEFGNYRPSDVAYKICFIHLTTVLNCDVESDESFIRLARFDQLLAGKLIPRILIDIVGLIHTIGEITDIDVHGKPTKKIELVLRDNEKNTLDCTLWGKYAEIVNDACQNSNHQSVVCLIQFAKINLFRETISICNAFNASIVLTDDSILEIKAFKDLFSPESLALTPMVSKSSTRELTYSSHDYYLQYPTKIVFELLETDEVGKCHVLCTINKIDTDVGWFYFGCNKCHKKVYRETSNVTIAALASNSAKFYCENCKGFSKSVSARYKLHFEIKDETVEAMCMLFDAFGVEVVGQTANALLGGSLEEIEDPDTLPDPLMNVIGKKFHFLISVEPKNITRQADTYKVSKVISLDGINTEGSDMPLTLEDQHVLQLTNTGEISEVSMSTCTTPSSKRKEDECGDLDGERSVNKKHWIVNSGIQEKEEVEEKKVVEIKTEGVGAELIADIAKKRRKGIMESKKLKFDPSKVKQEKVSKA